MIKKNILHVGIDLGTSRTVFSCDNGVRTFVPSYVGYPKDAVSSKLINKEVVFGEEALKYRMAVDFYKPLDKGVIKYSDASDSKSESQKIKAYEATKHLLKHMISLVLDDEPDPDNTIIRGVIGAPALASLKNKTAIIDISKGIIHDVMVVSEPFTVAYGLNMLFNTLIIDIGAGTVDLCRMHGTMPTEEDQITTFKAGDYIDQLFLDLIRKKYAEANFTLNMVKKFKEDNAAITEKGEQIIIELPVKGKPIPHDVTYELKTACQAIVPDIVEGIRKLVASFDPEFQDDLKKNIVLAGGGSQIIGLKKEIELYMKETLGYGRVTKVEEPLFAGANGALMLSKDMPDEYWDELNLSK
nr:magnetosome protein MamK-2 [Desulfobacteraceae bacterium]